MTAQHDPRATGGRRGFWGTTLLTCVIVLGYLLATQDVDSLRGVVGLPSRDAPPAGSARSYAFSQTQPGSDQPVGWDPCTPIRVELNPDGAPPGGPALVRRGLAHVSRATGLTLTVVGRTTDTDWSVRRQGAGGRPRPVLVGWTTPGEVPALRGDVAGLGGATSVGVPGGLRTYVTGSVALDRAEFARLVRDGREDVAQAIVDHELGHLVGLAHVPDRSQLMAPSTLGGVTSFQAGDLAGLALLGRIPCR